MYLYTLKFQLSLCLQRPSQKCCSKMKCLGRNQHQHNKPRCFFNCLAICSLKNYILNLIAVIMILEHTLTFQIILMSHLRNQI